MTFTPRKRPAQAALAATATLTLALLACETPVPVQPAGESESILAAVVSGQASTDSVTDVERPPVVRVHADGGSAQAEPLFIVDGAIVDPASGFDLESLDPETIERIEVVKGGAATALYGERAAGGVIRIFMKTAFRYHPDQPSGY